MAGWSSRCQLLCSRTFQLQPYRGMVLLRRRHELPPQPADAPVNFTKLKDKHYVYDVVRDDRNDRIPDIECVLTTHVDNLGSRGQVVKVKRSYFRKYLYLAGMAVYASPDNLMEYKPDESTVAKTPHALQTYRLLCGLNLPIKMNYFKSWTLTSSHVLAAFRLVGIHINSEDCISLPHRPITNEHDEKLPFHVLVKVNGLDEATVNCYIEPFTTLSEKETELPASLDLPLHRPSHVVNEELRQKGLYYGTTETV